MNEKQLLMQALNRNTSIFSNHANEARGLSNGLMRVLFDNISKSIIFQFNQNMITMCLEQKYIKGLIYLNHIKIDDILTRVEIEK